MAEAYDVHFENESYNDAVVALVRILRTVGFVVAGALDSQNWLQHAERRVLASARCRALDEVQGMDVGHPSHLGRARSSGRVLHFPLHWPI